MKARPRGGSAKAAPGRAGRGRPGAGAGAPSAPGACCLVSALLEEAGLDRPAARRALRHVLEGVALLCLHELERLDGTAGRGPRRAPR